MGTIVRDSWFFRGVPAQWQPLEGFIGEYFWRRLPRRGAHIGAMVPEQMFYPVWLGPPNSGLWLHYKQGLHLAKSGPGRLFPRYPTTMRGPWGQVEYLEQSAGTVLGGLEGLATDVFAQALGAVAKIFPKKYRADVELALTAAAAAWTAGALSGLILQALPALEPVIAKKVAGKLVDQVLNPRLVMSALAAPPAPPNMNISGLIGKLMGPLDAAAALSTKGDPADGIGNNMAAAAAKVVAAGENATAADKKTLQIAATAVGQMQSNLAILTTLAFTNSIRANLVDIDPIKFSGGWTPDQWFAWVESLPRTLIAKAAPAPRHTRGRWTGVQNFNINEAKIAVTKVTMHQWQKAQSSPTARRDCLRAYFKAAGIPTRVADWVQGMIDASPSALQSAKAGGSIVHVLLQASTDAVHAATAAHARALVVGPSVPAPSHTVSAVKPIIVRPATASAPATAPAPSVAHTVSAVKPIIVRPATASAPAPAPAPSVAHTVSAIVPIVKKTAAPVAHASVSAARAVAASTPKPGVFTPAPARASSEHKLAPALFGATLILKALASGVI